MSWSKYGWYRLFIPRLLAADIKRVLYLDCDVCICDMLDELFDMDMNDKAIAAAEDPESYIGNVYTRLGIDRSRRYVCSGVMMMNLDVWRSEGIASKVLEYGRKYRDKTHFPDQDAINVVCQDSKVILSPAYSPFLRIAKHFPAEEWKEFFTHPVIVHYAGCAPWKGNPNNHPFHHLWWKAFKGLPFRFWSVRISFYKIQMKIMIKKWLGRN